MSLVALDGTPLVMVGGCGRNGTQTLAALSFTTIDSVNEGLIFVGQIFTEDGGSHTIDTTGSSSLGWRTSNIVFADGGTTVKVGLAAVSATEGPPARAVNVSDVITFDVAAVFTGGGGGITSNAWNESVPTTGTKTIANGDLVAFAVQASSLGGSDALNVGRVSSIVPAVFPACTQNINGTIYNTVAAQPNAVITFSDGVRGYFFGGYVASVGSTTQTWNSGSATKEYGNYFKMPWPTKVYGLSSNVQPTNDFDVVLYSDPLGTPVAEKTISVDLNQVGANTVNLWWVHLFPSPYTTTANQPLAGILKPGASNIGAAYLTLNSSAHQTAWPLGANCYAINRASGAFAAQNSNKDRFGMALLVGAWDNT